MNRVGREIGEIVYSNDSITSSDIIGIDDVDAKGEEVIGGFVFYAIKVVIL